MRVNYNINIEKNLSHILWKLLTENFNCIGPILSVVITVFAIIGIINALGGKAKELPLIGKFKILK